MKTCPQCRSEFAKSGPNQKYCSVACREAMLSADRKAARAEKRLTIACEHCGSTFTQDRARTRYCSHSCAAQNAATKRVKPIKGSCRRCGAPKGDRGRGVGYCSAECREAEREALYAARRTRRFLKNWSLTADEYAALMANGCEVCGTHEDLKVDHDHACCAGSSSCGKCIRGALCGRCNAAEGMLLGNPERAMQLAFYMLKNTNVLEALHV